MIYAIAGPPHAGKSLFLEFTCMLGLDYGKQVFTNFHNTYAPNGNKSNFIDIGELALWVEDNHTLK